jgi:hypothetical protein
LSPTAKIASCCACQPAADQISKWRPWPISQISFSSPGVLAQGGRNQQAPGAIEFHLLGKTHQQAPHHGGFRLQAGGGENLGADRLPRGLRIEQQTAMGMRGQHQAPFAQGHQGVAMPARHRHAAFGIQIQRRRTLKHPLPPSGNQALVSLYFPQTPTRTHFKTLFYVGQAGKALFFQAQQGLR